jgi:4-hydroxy-3-polyprenylbenzoate decarboxylase
MGTFPDLAGGLYQRSRDGVRTVGMYRMQVFDKRTTAMHWHPHHQGAKNYRKAEAAGKRLEVAVTWAATPPSPTPPPRRTGRGGRAVVRRLPPSQERRDSQVQDVDLWVNADAEVVLEGYVEPGERRLEGPFGTTRDTTASPTSSRSSMSPA